jgi:hypothetical protein
VRRGGGAAAVAQDEDRGAAVPRVAQQADGGFDGVEVDGLGELSYLAEVVSSCDTVERPFDGYSYGY